MHKDQSLLEMFTGQAGQLSLSAFILNFLLAALLSYLLGRFYVRFGRSISNRETFGNNFMLITMTTVLIITIVKSSLALSLGLVGALSIIRFRAAIKEPEELSYLFLAISLGLGFGAEQSQITIVAFLVTLAVLLLRHFVHRQPEAPNLYLTITTSAPAKAKLPQVMAALGQCAAAHALKRFDETPELLEASFQVQFRDAEALNKCNELLKGLSHTLKISYLDEKGIGA